MLRLPSQALPASAIERHATLREYFCDKDATAAATDDGWLLTMDWPADAERHVDPRLLEGLAWWNEGVRIETMFNAQRRSGRILTALYDTWTLHSWSEWLQRGGRANDLTILHVDDHRDVAAPRLMIGEDGFRDAITSSPVDIFNPDQVRAAIDSGAIGMGSFLTPFLHIAPQADVRHLCQPPKAQLTKDYCITLTRQVDTLLQPGAARPAIDLQETSRGIGPGRYRLTPSLDDWIEGPARPALLHIDMDYFCNRYDGDGMWACRTERLDPSLNEVLTRIDAVVAALDRYVQKAPVEDIVIAYSPGFFPAEFWREADARLRAGLEALNGE